LKLVAGSLTRTYFRLTRSGNLRFEFATASRIIFGPGSSASVPSLAARFGIRAFVITDSANRAAKLISGLIAEDIHPVLFEIKKEPDIDTLILAIRKYTESACDIVLGLGGGSVLDTGKAVAALSANPGDPRDYLEVIGAGRKLEKSSAVYIAIPTTAGTGSEATMNSVISVPEKKIKVSLRSPFLLPRLSIIDPELTYSLPPTVTANSGLDALTQVIEPFVCKASSPLADALCRDGIKRASRSLLPAYLDGSNFAAREEMCLVSLYGGMALANARLGAVHGLAGPLGGMYQAPHGAICARLLPLVMKTNLKALRSRQPDSPSITRYEEIAQMVCGKEDARAEDGLEFIQHLCDKLEIRSLGEYGLQSEDFSTLVLMAQKSSSMRGNPIGLTDSELTGILELSK
jgi:alcohol dehydrogenase class IV